MLFTLFRTHKIKTPKTGYLVEFLNGTVGKEVFFSRFQRMKENCLQNRITSKFKRWKYFDFSILKTDERSTRGFYFGIQFAAEWNAFEEEQHRRVRTF